jgi:hypothetical protein
LKKISSSQGKGGDDRYDRIFYLTFWEHLPSNQRLWWEMFNPRLRY